MESIINEFLTALQNNSILVEKYNVPNNLDESFASNKYKFDRNQLLEEQSYTIDVLMDDCESGMFHHDDFSVLKLNEYRFPNDLEESFIESLDGFREIFAKNNYWSEKVIKTDISQKIKASKLELESLLLLFHSQGIRNLNLISLIKVKIEICSEALRYINYAPILQTIQEGIRPVKTPKAKKSFASLTDLTQNQVIILIHYLKGIGLLGKEMPKNLMAASVSEITGFSSEKLRQGFSHIESKSDSVDNLSFSEQDYSIIRRALEKIIDNIKSDSQAKFSTNT